MNKPANETTAARVAEPLSEERIEEFRDRAQAARELLVTVEDGWGQLEMGEHELDDLLDEITRLRAVIAERDAEIGAQARALAASGREIARLRGWLSYIRGDWTDPRDAIRAALKGEEVWDE